MTYAAAETLLYNRVLACASFDADNSSQANWKVLNSGKSDHYAILHVGKSSLDWTTLGQYTITWRCIVEVWQRYKDDGTTATSLYGYVNDLLPILAYPHLGGTITDSTLEAIGEAEEMWRQGDNGPLWLRQNLTIAWQEETNVTFAE
jgi:hypothetical protein